MYNTVEPYVNLIVSYLLKSWIILSLEKPENLETFWFWGDEKVGNCVAKVKRRRQQKMFNLLSCIQFVAYHSYYFRMFEELSFSLLKLSLMLLSTIHTRTNFYNSFHLFDLGASEKFNLIIRFFLKLNLFPVIIKFLSWSFFKLLYKTWKKKIRSYG